MSALCASSTSAAERRCKDTPKPSLAVLSDTGRVRSRLGMTWSGMPGCPSNESDGLPSHSIFSARCYVASMALGVKKSGESDESGGPLIELRRRTERIIELVVRL